MANTQTPSLSLDAMLQESRQKRKAEELAQEIFGKKNRSRTPQGPRAKPALGATLASRVGVAKKRTASLPRSNTAPQPRNPRSAAQPTRPATNFRTHSTIAQPLSDPVIEAKSNGFSRYDAPTNRGGSINIRGAAQSGPHVVIAQNFAPGTTEADIESVMSDVGGQVLDCKLLASNPTVIAELVFAEKAGAETVINTFNGKKADGRTLNVYLKASGGAARVDAYADLEGAPEEIMEVDENAQAREVEDRRREELRGRPDRASRDQAYPTGPRGDRGYDDGYGRGGGGGRHAEPTYQDGRHGYQGGDRYNHRGGNFGGRMYSDRMGGRGGGQSWRP